MSTNNENTQVLEPVAEEEIVATETLVEEAATEEVLAPVIKTKKEIKKERKAIKKHKKEIKKEAKMHSAKATKAQKFFLGVLSLIVIASMIFCSYGAVVATMNITKIAQSVEDTNTPQDSTPNDNNSQQNNNNQQSNNQQNNNTDTNTNPGTDSEDTSSPAGDTNTPGGDAPATGDINSKEAAVEYYKTAHAKVLAEAKSVTRTYDNPTNYNSVVEVGNNSTISGIAQTLMTTFMKENTEAVLHEGSDAIKANFPPTGDNGSAGLTADMIADYKCEEKDGNYILTLTLKGTEENPDDGTMAIHLVDTVEISQITEAAGSFVTLDGFKNQYVGSTVTATIEKESGKMTDLEVYNPTYMCFDKATAMGFISVTNCRLGLLFEQKWTVQW